jgi:hypothetical protein
VSCGFYQPAILDTGKTYRFSPSSSRSGTGNDRILDSSGHGSVFFFLDIVITSKRQRVATNGFNAGLLGGTLPRKVFHVGRGNCRTVERRRMIGGALES